MKISKIKQGNVVFTIHNKYYLLSEIFSETSFWGFEFPDYRNKGAFLEINDIIEIIELPKNIKLMIFKKMEKIVEKKFRKGK